MEINKILRRLIREELLNEGTSKDDIIRFVDSTLRSLKSDRVVKMAIGDSGTVKFESVEEALGQIRRMLMNLEK